MIGSHLGFWEHLLKSKLFVTNLLRLITFKTIFLEVNIANIWQIKAEVWKFLILAFCHFHERPPVLKDHITLRSLHTGYNIFSYHLFKQELNSSLYDMFPCRKQWIKCSFAKYYYCSSKSYTFLYTYQTAPVLKNAQWSAVAPFTNMV